MKNTAISDYSFRQINKERLYAITEHAGSTLLDVGCGNGAYVIHLASNEYSAIGIDSMSYDSWLEAPSLFSLGDAAQLPFEDNSIDTIISFEALEHVANPEAALSEFYRVSKRNIIITVPNCSLTEGMKGSQLVYHHWVDSTHINFFDMSSISNLVCNAGFKIEFSYYINEISLSPLFEEAFNLRSRWLSKVLFKFIRSKKEQRYFLTCLIVASKNC